ncbi:MAG: hypothetical protein JNM69_08250 [Archangium sp.]|nr:hypothetical protein [Archangium sp.]
MGAVAVLIVAFAAFALLLWRDVKVARSAIEHDVGWLIAVQHLDELSGDPATDLTTALDAVRAAAGPDGAPALVDLERAVRQRDVPALHASSAQLTRTIRKHTALVSAQLGEAWSRLSLLVAASLVLAASTMVLLLAWARARAKLIEQTAREREAAIRESLRVAEALQALAAQVTHDLANPLAFVVSNHHFVLRRLSEVEAPDEEALEALRDSGEGLLRLESLVTGLRSANALSRSGPDARAKEVLDAVLQLVEPRIRRTAGLVREFEALGQSQVNPLPFMRLMSAILMDAAELCGPSRSVVRIGATSTQLTVSVEGVPTRDWASTLQSVADELRFDVAIAQRPPSVTIALPHALTIEQPQPS